MSQSHNHMPKLTCWSLKPANFRYPSDGSDRIWKSLANSKPWTNTSNDNANNVSVPLKVLQTALNLPNANANNVSAPLEVLRTALNHSERLEFHEVLDKECYEYHVFLYFLELNGNVISSQRVFDIYINNEKIKENFDILADGSIYEEVVWNVTANGSLNLTLTRVSGSELGPICNAYEILQVRPWVPETDQKDGELNLPP